MLTGFGVWFSGTILTACMASMPSLDPVPYGIGNWEGTVGNHRARILVDNADDAVWVRLPWRRRDQHPDQKQVKIMDATTGNWIQNVARMAINREYGNLVFQPETVPGEYYVYYMPYDVSGWAHMPTITYPAPLETADPDWVAKHRLAEDDSWRQFPQAQVLEFQACSEFHRFDPMEVIATQEETSALCEAHTGEAYLIFPEDRERPIRMSTDLPFRWIQKGPSRQFQGEAFRGEFYVFQLGLYPLEEDIELADVRFSPLRDSEGASIPASTFRCFNLDGTNWLGRSFSRIVEVPRQTVGALWFGIQIPTDVPAGTYRGRITLHPINAKSTDVEVELAVSDEVIEDAGDGELWRLTRLRWLDSTIGMDDEVVAPYTPLQIQDATVTCLNREVHFADTALPDSIRSNGHEILAAPIQMILDTPQGEVVWDDSDLHLTQHTPGAVVYESTSVSDQLEMRCQAKMEFDGYINVSVTLSARKAVAFSDIRLEIPLRQAVATYMMGLGCKGGCRPSEWRWMWDANRANNAVWLGDVEAGLHCKLKGSQDTWDLYNLHTSGIPDAWGNGGKGGCDVLEVENTVVVRAFSGPRSMYTGDALEFRFGLLITPVKPLDPAHWDQRYYHAFVPVDTAVENGANIINIHHGNELNPNINYPFVAVDKLHDYIREAHEKGVKVKIYYTVRELSNYVAELWALRSLGHEIFTGGGGGGDSWLQEHLVDDYGSAWHHPLAPHAVDAAIATTGLSRWHNYYLEGLAWLLRNVELDGLYLDGIGYDREIMKRVRKVMERERPGALIDFHSGNNFHPQYGLANCANQYMEHFPYIDSLWFGEGFDYNESPDYWLVEISGIPFGLFGEMLQNNGNPWRGMIYGMTARYYSGADPKHIWRLWDDFGIQDAEMLGYWHPACPVKTDAPDVLATVYRKAEKALVSIASWAPDTVHCHLLVNWQPFGLLPESTTVTAPEITGFQPARHLGLTDPITVEPGKGWLLLLTDAR